MSFITRGFRGRRGVRAPEDRVPPGQYVTTDFPVLTAGPTPRFPEEKDWRFAITDADGSERAWTWAELTSLPRETITVDIHCVTKWSKLDTRWSGVSLDTLLVDVNARGSHAFLHCYGGYTTNLPLEDITGGKAWIAFIYDRKPLDPEHGGPARLLVPHLYFWKSAKWVSKMVLYDFDRPGFWETLGYHNYGDPWLSRGTPATEPAARAGFVCVTSPVTRSFRESTSSSEKCLRRFDFLNRSGIVGGS